MVDLSELRQKDARAEGRYLGIGMAPSPTPLPFPDRGTIPWERSRCECIWTQDGTVGVVTGQMPDGEGHETTVAQIAADEFGKPFKHVREVTGDSDVAPKVDNRGSRSATMAGAALVTGPGASSRGLSSMPHQSSSKPALPT